MKRKQKTSLLKLANIKKRRTKKQIINTYGYDRKDVVKIAEFPEIVLSLVDQLTKTKNVNEKLTNQQYKQALQQVDMISLDQNQGVFNHCGCLVNRNNYPCQFILAQDSQEQQMNSKAHHFNLNVKRANLSVADNFKVIFKTQEVQTCDGDFYQQHVAFYPKYNRQNNIYTTQPNWTNVNKNRSYVLNLNSNICFHNHHVPYYDQKQTFPFSIKFYIFNKPVAR